MISAAIPDTFYSHSSARRAGELRDHLRRDGLPSDHSRKSRPKINSIISPLTRSGAVTVSRLSFMYSLHTTAANIDSSRALQWFRCGFRGALQTNKLSFARDLIVATTSSSVI